MARPTYVIATDLSPSSRRAAGIAGRLARRTHAAIEFFCAVPADSARTSGIDLERARAAVEAFARRRSFEAGRSATASVAMVRDVPAAILRHVARIGADLLVMAPHGASGWRRPMLGSVTEKVLRRAEGSVLVARGTVGTPFRRIVAGVVPGPGGEAPMRHAIAYARARRAELVAVHVVRPTELMLPRVATARLLRTDDMARETAELKRWVASFPAHGVNIDACVLEGSPGEALVGEARRRRADLVVVGATHGSRVRRAVLGSVAYAVAAASPVSVLVVRGPAGRQ